MATQTPVEQPARRFLIPVKKGWKLWIPPVIALAYLAGVLAIVLTGVELGVPQQDLYLVLGGVGLFAVLLLWELLLLPTVKVRGKKAKAARAAPEAAPAQAEAPPETVDLGEETPVAPEDEVFAPQAGGVRQGGDVELVLTPQQHQGRRVIEVSVPPKSAHPGAIYSKAHIVVDDRFTIRVEDLVAEPDEFQ